MNRKQVLLLLSKCFDGLIETLPDTIEEFETQHVLIETQQYLLALCLDPVNLRPSPLGLDDWEDFMQAIGFLREYRLADDWYSIEPYVTPNLDRFCQKEPHPFERLSLWDMAMHVVSYHESLRWRGIRTPPLAGNHMDTIARLVRRELPSRDAIELAISTLDHVLEQRLEELTELAGGTTEEEEVPSWMAGSYEYMAEVDRPPAAQPPRTRSCAEEEAAVEYSSICQMRDYLAAEWNRFSIAVLNS